MQVSCSDLCDTSILSTVSNLAQGQISERCPSTPILPVLPLDVAFMQQLSSYQFPVLKKRDKCMYEPATITRDPFAEKVSILAKGQTNEECVLRNVALPVLPIN